MTDTMDILSYFTTPNEFIERMQGTISNFVTAIPGQEYSYRLIAPEFVQFDQGGDHDESNIALEIAFQQQTGPLKEEAYRQLDIANTVIPALQDLIANAINPAFAQAVTERMLKDLEKLDGPFHFQEMGVGSIVLGFKQTVVLFLRHTSIVTH